MKRPGAALGSAEPGFVSVKCQSPSVEARTARDNSDPKESAGFGN